MPLNKPNGIDLMGLPYEVKVNMVEAHCIGCGYLEIKMEEDTWPQYRCVYPHDILGVNEYIHGRGLDVVDISTNTCMFWGEKNSYDTPEKPDSTPDYESTSV